MAIKAVIWDIGGVLLRTEDRRPRAALATELGLSYEDLVELVFGGERGHRAQRGEISPTENWSYVRQALELSPDQHTDLSQRFFGGDVLDQTLVNFIRSLRPRYLTAIISNAWRNLPEMLAQWGLAGDFDVVVGSGDVGIMKPDARIYQIALERLGVQPQEAIFIDDFIENVEGARQLGLLAVHFRNRQQALDELAQHGVKS